MESISDDNLLSIILQFASPSGAARLGLANKTWTSKILAAADGKSCDFAQKLWIAFAVQRWGRAVVSHESNNNNPSWYQYYRRRCSSWKRLPEISHLDLIQEYYAHDPYRLLAACILCSRTSGGPLIRETVLFFLEKYATPTAVMKADISVMSAELHPLGLKRERTMVRFAADFLNSTWSDVTELHGCGAFAASSFDIFCRGDYKKVLKDKKADRNVKAYASYVKKLSEGGDVNGADDAKGGSGAHASENPKKRRRRKQGNVIPVRKMTRGRE